MGRAEEEGGCGKLVVQQKLYGDEMGESIVPMHVLFLLFARLSVVDVIRSGAVCVSWRSAVKEKDHLSPRTIRPWLALHKEITDHSSRFLDTNTGRIYTIHLPELHQKRLVGKSDHGFLVYEDQLSKRLSMINPITRATICFPPLPAPYRLVGPVLVVSSPSSSKDTGCTVLIQRGGMFLAFAGVGIHTWGRLSILDSVRVSGLGIYGTKLCGLLGRSHSRHIKHGFYQFFTCDLDVPADFKVWAFKFYKCPWSTSDFGGSFPDHPCVGDEDGEEDCLLYCCYTEYYSVVLPNGDQIVVCRAVTNEPRTDIVKVYRMPADLNGEADIATSIGAYALFLDEYRYVVLSTLEFPELKANTIYFSDDCSHVDDTGFTWSPVKGLVMFDLEAQHLVEYSPISMKMSDYISAAWFTPAF